MNEVADPRSLARRLAVQALYQMEFAGASAEEAIEAAIVVVDTDDLSADTQEQESASNHALRPEVASAVALARQVAENRAAIDDAIEGAGATAEATSGRKA